MRKEYILVILALLILSCTKEEKNKALYLKRDLQKELELLTNDQKESLKIYEKALNMKTNTQSEKRESLQLLSKALDLDKNNYEALFARGWRHFELGDYNEGIMDYTNYIKALEGLTDCSKAYCNRGIIYWNNEQLSLAVTDFNSAIKIAVNDKDKGRSYFNRGKLKYVEGDKESACEDWSIAGELGYTDAYKQMESYCY